MSRLRVVRLLLVSVVIAATLLVAPSPAQPVAHAATGCSNGVAENQYTVKEYLAKIAELDVTRDAKNRTLLSIFRESELDQSLYFSEAWMSRLRSAALDVRAAEVGYFVIQPPTILCPAHFYLMAALAYENAAMLLIDAYVNSGDINQLLSTVVMLENAGDALEYYDYQSSFVAFLQ